MEPADLPRRLAELHRRAPSLIAVSLPTLPIKARDTIITGAGFQIRSGTSDPILLRRLDELPDSLTDDLRVLCIGLNPSRYSADQAIPFGRPGNRFWPAALKAGLVSRDRDLDHALRIDRVGFTDMVRRPTARAAELSSSDYRSGVARLRALVELWRPQRICFVGLTGWRAAFGPAAAGWHDDPGVLGTNARTPVYLMPSTSGLNAHAQIPDLVAHFEAVLAGPGADPTRPEDARPS